MTAKFIPTDKDIDRLLKTAEEEAYQDYDAELEMLENKSSLIHKYDFNRGFEYGIQWASDNRKDIEP